MDAVVSLVYGGAFLILLLLVVLSRRARRHGGALQAGVMGAMYELQNQDKQKAVDFLVEGRAGATPSETRPS